MFKRTANYLICMLLSVQLYGQGTDYKAVYMVDGAQEKEQYRSHVYLEAIEPRSCVTCVKGGAKLILTYMHMSKTSGASKDISTRNSGINSILLAIEGSRVYSEECEYNVHVENTDAVNCQGEGTFVDIIKGQFRMSRSMSSSIYAADGGRVRIVESEINASASSSEGMRTGRGGSIEANKLTGGTTGLVSPLFESKGSITASKCRLSADRWSMARIGGGYLELTNNELKSNGLCGFMFSNGREETGVLELTKNKLQISDGPLFIVDGADARITVDRNTIALKSKDLLVFESADEDSVLKPGSALLNVNHQELKGNIKVNRLSTLTVNLNKGAKLNSGINTDNVEGSHIDIVLNHGGQWLVREDSYVSSVSFETSVDKGVKQIKGKHTVYYDASNPANAPLGGQEFKTKGGGMLRPYNR